MQKLLVPVVVLLALAGCAAHVVSSNPRSVVVDPGDSFGSSNSAEAQRLADAECKKHDRFAALKGRLTSDAKEYVFDCVL